MKLTEKEILACQLHSKQVGIWYLGQEGFLLKSGNSYLAVDPYLSDYVDTHCSDFVKWERLYEPPICAEELCSLDVVLCTHSHYDHADPITLKQLAKNNPTTKFVVPAPEIATITAYGIKAENMIPAVAWEKIEVADYEIIPVPSAHEILHMDENGNYKELGYIIRTNGKTFFHAGDMCMYDGLVESLKAYEIDVAFLPINGRDYFRNQNDIIGNFNCEEAVQLAKEVGADMLVPMHHDLYAVNRVRTAHFVDAVEMLDPYRKYHIFAPGELYIKE